MNFSFFPNGTQICQTYGWLLTKEFLLEQSFLGTALKKKLRIELLQKFEKMEIFFGELSLNIFDFDKSKLQ